MTLDRIKRLKDKIELKEKPFDPDSLVDAHHLLMKEYGWISVEEFAELPIPTLWNLLDCIKKQHELEEREMDKAKHRGKH